MQPTYYIALAIGLVAIFTGLIQRYRHKKKVRQFIKSRYYQAPVKGHTDKLESIREYWQTCAKQLPEYKIVDDITWNDLELDLVFDNFNSTYSSLGSEVLYARLHRLDGPDLDLLIDRLKQDEDLRTEIAYFLHGLAKRDYHGASQFLFDPESQKMIGIWPGQGFIPIVGALLLPIYFPAGLILTMGGMMWNFYTRFKVKISLEGKVDSISYIAKALYMGKKIAEVSRESLPDYSTKLSLVMEPLKKIPTNIPMELDSTSIMGMIMDFLNNFILLDYLQYNRALKSLIAKPEALHHFWETLGDVEIALVLASLSERQLLTKPEIISEHAIKAQAIFHPLIENPVPNPVDFSHSTLVSGSNASGKSTYVKAIAISAITAQNLNRAFAQSFLLKPGQILTSMAIRDDIYAGDSYFVAEIKSLKRMIDAAQTGKTLYLFIDEILKGTNTIERIAASNALLHFFHDNAVPVIAATHDIELTELQADKMRNIHFREEIEEEEIRFDYQLKDGPTQTTNAINLLKYYDFPSSVTNQADFLADHFKQTRSWSEQ